MITKENIIRIIDKSIIETLHKASLIETIESLEQRIDKFTIIICKDNPEIVFNEYMKMEIDSIETGRLRYNICQIKHCGERINDIKWIIRNRKNFPMLSNKQIFNLLLLKEKLQKKEEV